MEINNKYISREALYIYNIQNECAFLKIFQDVTFISLNTSIFMFVLY